MILIFVVTLHIFSPWSQHNTSWPSNSPVCKYCIFYETTCFRLIGWGTDKSGIKLYIEMGAEDFNICTRQVCMNVWDIPSWKDRISSPTGFTCTWLASCIFKSPVSLSICFVHLFCALCVFRIPSSVLWASGLFFVQSCICLWFFFGIASASLSPFCCLFMGFSGSWSSAIKACFLFANLPAFVCLAFCLR